MNLTLTLITKNESQNLDNWAKWLPKLKLVNQLVVIDSQSTDDTGIKARKMGSSSLRVDIYQAKNPNNFSALRTQAVTASKNNWILWLDADETPSTELINFLNEFDFTGDSYSFPRHDIFLGKPLSHGETANQQFVRLFDKQKGKFSGAVHERWTTASQPISTNHPISHVSHKTLAQFIHKINIYSDLRATELKGQGSQANLFTIISYPVAKFFVDYFVYLGFLDGTPGIIFALGMSFHSFLTRAKLWHLSKQSSV